MALSEELLTALLSMDSYNRGDTPGIEGLYDQNPSIGPATFLSDSEALLDDQGQRRDIPASFYAAAYATSDGTVISYRGTDSWDMYHGDPAHGFPVAAGNALATQAELAVDFYHAVVGENNPFSSGILLTGHSLGGGLAGLVASVYGQSADIYDSMAFELAAENVEAVRLYTIDPVANAGSLSGLTQQQVDGILDTYFPDQDYQHESSNSLIGGAHIEGESLATWYGSWAGSELDDDEFGNEQILGNLSGVERHNQALLVILMYFDEQISQQFVDDNWELAGKEILAALFDEDVGSAAGFDEAGTNGHYAAHDKMKAAIAYSVVDQGTTVFGDAAIRAMLGDSDDLGTAYAGISNQSGMLSWLGLSLLAPFLVQYAGKLAANKVELPDGDPTGAAKILDGILGFEHFEEVSALIADVSADRWEFGSVGDGVDDVRQSFADGVAIYSGLVGGEPGEAFAAMEFVTKFGLLLNGDDAFVGSLDDLVDSAQSDGAGLTAWIGTGFGDEITGTSGNDIIFAGANENPDDAGAQIFGGLGNDLIVGSNGDDHLEGGKGTNFLFGGDGSDIFKNIGHGGSLASGGEGDDHFYLDVISSTGGDRALYSGGLGQDTFYVDMDLVSGAVLWGGAGADTFALTSTGAAGSVQIINIDGLTEADFVEFDVQKLIEQIAEFERTERGKNGYSVPSIYIINPDSEDKISINGNMLTGSDYQLIDEEYNSPTDFHYYYGFTDDTYDYIPTNFARHSANPSYGVTIENSDDSEAVLRILDLQNGMLGVSLNGDGPDYEFYDPDHVGAGRAKPDGWDSGSSIPLDVAELLFDQKIVGTIGDDFLQGGSGNDNLIAGPGNDTIEGGSGLGDDFYDGGSGNDTIIYPSTSLGVYVDLQDNVAFGYGDEIGNDTLSGIENVVGGSGDDDLIGDANANILNGAAGDDWLTGGAGNDTLIGDAGEDSYGWAIGDGNDTIVDNFSSVLDQDDLYIEGVDPTSVQITAAGMNIVLTFASGETIELIDQLATDGRGIEFVRFDNGTIFDDGDVWDRQYLVDNVAQLNSAPIVATALLDQSSAEDNAVNFTLPAGAFSDADGDALTLSAALVDGSALPTWLVFDAVAGSFSGTPPQDYVGTLHVRVTASDGSLAASDDFELEITAVGGVTLIGDGGDNLLIGGIHDDTLSGLSGDDELEGGSGADDLDGGTGSDTASYAGSAIGVIADLDNSANNTGDASGDSYTSIENLRGSGFADQLNGDASANILSGGLGDDLLAGSGGNDTLYGEDGDDTLQSSDGSDAFYGGEGVDRVSYSGAGAGLRVHLGYAATNTGDAAGDTYNSIEILEGSAYADELIAAGIGNSIYGLEGDDTITGSGNADVLHGDQGNDVVYAGGGNDIVVGGADDDSLHGESGDDVLEGGLGSDYLNGGYGFDTVSYENASSAVRVHLGYAATNTGEAAGDTYSSIEALIGSAHDDELIASSVAVQINGGAGNDTITGNGNVNVLHGEDGNDVIYAGSASDRVFGGVGNDSLHGQDGDDVLEGGEGADYLNGGSGADTASYAAALAAVDVFLANASSNAGEAAGDTYSSIENVFGSVFDDSLSGNSSSNVLTGAAGNDTLTGGGGDDTFVFQDGFGEDVVTDFTAGVGSEDVIEFENTVFADYAAVLAAASQVGSGTLITYDGSNSVLLENITLGNLHADDFRFVA